MNAGGRKLSAEAVRRLILEPGPWLSCDVCFQLVDQYVEQLLAGAAWDMPAMRAHLRGCSACAEEAESLLLLAAEYAGVDPGPALRRLHGGPAAG